MKRFLLATILTLAAVGCQAQPNTDCAEKLNGTWQGGPLTVTYDFEAGQTTSVALGQEKTKSLEIQKCSADEAVILSGETQVLITFDDADHIALSAAGKIPLQMTRMPAK